MTAAIITPPAVEPVTLAEAKAHLRVAIEEDDDLIGALITAARSHIEATTRRLMIDQTWRIYRDDWPAGGIVELPFAPVAAVVAVTVYGADGAPAVVDPADYVVDVVGSPARIALKAAALARPGRAVNGIEIDLALGYGPSGVSVPQPLRQAIMMLVARWYDNRDGAVIGIVPASIAESFEALIAPYRAPRLR